MTSSFESEEAFMLLATEGKNNMLAIPQSVS